MTERRMTKQTVAILKALSGDPSAEWWGSRIAPAAGLKSGTLYPALMRMERFGWLSSRWEDIDPVSEGRPRRRIYRLTAAGQMVADEVLRPAVIRPIQPDRPLPPAGVPEGSIA